MKNMKHIAVTIIGLSLCACGENFFDLQPNYQVTVNKIYKTESDFDIAVLGCYAKLQTQMSFYTECCEYRSDNLWLNAPTSGTQDRYDIDQFQDVATNGILEDCWANFDNGVYRCNMVLDRIDAADIDAARKAQFKGEAMFIRAFTYFNMYRAWGGVPTTRRVVSVEEALKIGRSSDEQMFDLIAGDLKQIIDEEMLPSVYTGSSTGRVTSGAAKALLAKVYLTFGRAQEAASLLQGMIGSYELLPQVADVFSVDNKMNAEIIWAIRYNKEVVGEGHGAWYSIANLTDDANQTSVLKSLYDARDARKALIEYVQVPGIKVCLPRKLYDTQDSSTKQYGNDFIVLRYADVLLMYAEALNELGYDASQDSPALAALNQVHTRAGLDPLNITDIPDQTAFRKAVMLERQMEFPYEGHRWFDAVRMGGAQEAAAAEGHSIEEFRYLFPIPTTELERINNKALLWQNPGY